jgi:hypothetical protein
VIDRTVTADDMPEQLPVARRGTENQTTLISLGIPKLVRFHNIRRDS